MPTGAAFDHAVPSRDAVGASGAGPPDDSAGDSGGDSGAGPPGYSAGDSAGDSGAGPPGYSASDSAGDLAGDSGGDLAGNPAGNPLGGHEVGLHASVLDRLGQEIVSGTVPVDTVVRIDQLDERFGVSRSVIREAVRVLSSMGLVETRRRLGVRVRPRSQWNVFDPRVIRWRLDGPDREDQLVSLGELRRGFEPVAAELAADRATADQCGAMATAVMQMTVHAKSGDPVAYLEAEKDFHRTLLEASGNEMLAALATVVAEVLSGRTHHDLMPSTADPAAIRLHSDVAQAIGSGDAVAASEAMGKIIDAASAAASESLAGGRRS